MTTSVENGFNSFVEDLCAINLAILGDSKRDTVCSILTDYEWSKAAPYERWLETLIKCVHHREHVELVCYPPQSRASSILAELGTDCGWKTKEDGESIYIAFPELGMEMYISREGLDHQQKACYRCFVRQSSLSAENRTS